MVRYLMDRLRDTDQREALDDLHGIEVVSPHSADMVRLGDLGEAERRAAAAGARLRHARFDSGPRSCEPRTVSKNKSRQSRIDEHRRIEAKKELERRKKAIAADIAKKAKKSGSTQKRRNTTRQTKPSGRGGRH